MKFNPDTRFLNQVWCMIKLKGGYNQLVGVCYCSENKKIIGTENDMQLFELIAKLKGKHIILMGNFNYRDVD